jgi:hypothetical protein
VDPLTIMTTLWRHKWVTLPVVVLTIFACAYVYLYAPRTYQANVSYALAAPDVPSSLELEQDPGLAKLNSDNPYLRSGDSSLLAQVVITKLSDPAFVDQLKEAGFGTDFKIAPVASLGMGLISVNATSTSETEAVATAKLLGEQFTSTLNSVQKVNGADDRYLYSPILVLGPGPAQELFSNRLRSLIMVGIAGSILLFGSVSVARGRTLKRQGGTAKAVEAGSASGADSDPGAKEEGQVRRRSDQPKATRSGRRAHSPDPHQGLTNQFQTFRSVPPADPQPIDNDENERLVAAGERMPGR